MNHIEYGEDMLRPKLQPTGIDVHKIVNQIQNMDKQPDQIVDEYYASKGYVSERINGMEPRDIHEISDSDFPRMTEDMIHECIEFQERKSDLIESIIEEDEILKGMIFENSGDAENIKNKLEEQDFQYFEIKFSRDENSFSIRWD